MLCTISDAVLLLLPAQARLASQTERNHKEDHQPEEGTANPQYVRVLWMISYKLRCTCCLAYLARDRSTKKDLRAITKQYNTAGGPAADSKQPQKTASLMPSRELR